MNKDALAAKEEIKNWQSEDVVDVSDAIHRYFENSNILQWGDIADEAAIVWSWMFSEPYDEYSPIDAVVRGVAAQAAYGAYASVAKAFALDPTVVEHMFVDWEESPDKPPIAIDEFMNKYNEHKQWLEDLCK